jgi:hypothetical protein
MVTSSIANPSFTVETSSNKNEISGNLIVKINIELDSNFKRDGLNLIFEQTLTLKESIIGKILEIPHFEGVFMQNTKNFGVIDPNKTYILKNKGIINNNGVKGNLCFKFTITYPSKKLTDEEIKIFFDLKQILPQLKLKKVDLNIPIFGVFVDKININTTGNIINSLDLVLKLNVIGIYSENEITERYTPEYSINININETDSYIKIENKYNENIAKFIIKLDFALEMYNRIGKVEIYSNTKEPKEIFCTTLANHIFDYRNDSLLKYEARDNAEANANNIKNEISFAFLNFFTFLSNYLSWLRQETTKQLKLNDAPNQETVLQKYIKYKAKYIKLSNEINKHNSK